MPSPSELSAELQQLTQGLLFQSESDYPWQVSVLPAATPLPFEDGSAAEQQETVTLDYLLSGATEDLAEHTQAQKERAGRYRALKAWLQTHLHDLQVIKQGHRLRQVYITGNTLDGHKVVLQTQAVET